KMSTTFGSEAGTLFIRDSDAEMTRKIKSAVTDSGRDVVRGPGKAGIANLIEVAAVLRGIEPEEVEREFADAGYGDFKAAVAETVVEALAPIRERYLELAADRNRLERVLTDGAERARVLAYVDHLERTGELELEAATEFLVLIAALLELKSRLMLPGEEEGLDWEPQEAAEELLARMLEYARYRAAARFLHERLAAESGF